MYLLMSVLCPCGSRRALFLHLCKRETRFTIEPEQPLLLLVVSFIYPPPPLLLLLEERCKRRSSQPEEGKSASEGQ